MCRSTADDGAGSGPSGDADIDQLARLLSEQAAKLRSSMGDGELQRSYDGYGDAPPGSSLGFQVRGSSTLPARTHARSPRPSLEHRHFRCYGSQGVDVPPLAVAAGVPNSAAGVEGRAGDRHRQLHVRRL